MNTSVTRNGNTLEVSLENRSEVVAFFVDMKLKDAAGEIIVPAFWNDNFVTLAPGESRTFTCSTESLPADATVTVAGWNVPAVTLN